jgi:hypothetical protein
VFTTIPPHLKINRAGSSELQNQLFNEFGIIAIDHTDKHSPVVLKNMVFLLRHGFPHTRLGAMNSLKYLYAFAGHDSEIDLAAYHRDAKAISIGGISVYGDTVTSSEALEIKILGSLAHEIGHAFIFGRMSAPELRQVSERFGGWSSVFGVLAPTDFFAPAFFIRHPLFKKRIEREVSEKYGLISNYSAVGVHEWFSDAFAAFALNRLGSTDRLGKNWRERLIEVPVRRKAYGFNYNRLVDRFSAWLEKKF